MRITISYDNGEVWDVIHVEPRTLRATDRDGEAVDLFGPGGNVTYTSVRYSSSFSDEKAAQ